MGVGIQQGGEPVGEPGAIPVPGSTIQAPTQYSPANYGVSSSPRHRPRYHRLRRPGKQTRHHRSNSSQTSSINSLEDVANLLEWSPESRMVVANYGTEAPAILNQYALNLEGMLDSAVAWGQNRNNYIA